MKILLTAAVLLFTVLLPLASTADIITVDGGGGGDYLTIQEAVDVAAWGDTVLVHPGTYTSSQDCENCGRSNVCIHVALTLMSSGGPDYTVIDGAGLTSAGICSEWWFPIVVDGFTITNGGGGGGWGAAITLLEGEVRGNVLSSYGIGVSTDPMWYAAADMGPTVLRPATTVIEGNRIEGNYTGIYLRTWGSSYTDVTGNIVSDNESVGVSVHGTGNVSFVGNEVSGNTWGVTITNPSHTTGAQFAIEMLGNRIVDNEYENVSISLAEIAPGTRCDVTIGGSLGGANDIHGALLANLAADAFNVELSLDATYNYWGSVVCTMFVPLFDIDESVPDSAFTFVPFLDETHTVTYDCEGVPVHHATWGSIKALYR